MQTRILRAGSFVSLLLLMALTSSAAFASAAQTANSQTKPNPKPAVVSLGDASGEPGASIIVPIRLTVGDGPKLRRLKLDLVFASQNLRFEKITKSVGSEWKDLELTLEDYTTSGEGRQESSKVIVLASLLPGADASEGIPAGVFGNLNFHINDDADGDVINVELSAEATEVESNTPLPKGTVHTEDALVYVLAPGNYPGCFFFTH